MAMIARSREGSFTNASLSFCAASSSSCRKRPLLLVELTARFLQGSHQLPGALPDLRESVVGTENLGTEAEAGRAGAEPACDILGADAADRIHADFRRQHGAQRLQMPGPVGHRGK